MMPLHQFLEAHFHLLRSGSDLQPERVQGFPLGVADRSSFGARLLFRAQSFAKHLERISVAAKNTHVRSTPPLAVSNLPGRTLSRKGVLLLAHHRRIAHSGEKIVGLVVFAHVIEAKTPIVLLAPASHRRTVRR